MFIYFIRWSDVFYVQHSDSDLFVLFASNFQRVSNYLS